MPNSGKGFASMDKEKVKEIARKGGESSKGNSSTGSHAAKVKKDDSTHKNSKDSNKGNQR